MTRSLCTLFFLLLTVKAVSIGNNGKNACPEVKIKTEQLPDLNIPRAGHEVFCVNGEYVVAGGHTNGFVPTQTAEYFKNGKWQQIQMVYSHDFSCSLKLKSGKVLIAGGMEENIGVGQTFTAELYDPLTHSFNGFGSMERKRAKASAIELDSGRVVISGNWYHDDGIEVFDGKKKFTYIKDVSVQRTAPYLFRIAKDDILIVSGNDIHGDVIFNSIADRLKGDAVNIPLLETWHPLPVDHHSSDEVFIGDESKGIYTYLMAVKDKDGQVAIAKVEGANMTLLPTVCPIPLQSHGEQIEYFSSLIVDQLAGRAYLLGYNKEIHVSPEKADRYYVLCIDYKQQPKAGLTLYYTDPLPDPHFTYPILADDGNLIIAGGIIDSNFSPSSTVNILYVSTRKAEMSDTSRWPWIITVLVILAIFAAVAYLSGRHRQQTSTASTVPEDADTSTPKEACVAVPDTDVTVIRNTDTDIMRQICQVMEKEKLFLDSNLKVSDIASRVGTNDRYVSNCINAERNCSSTFFINSYRIKYAQQLMRQKPKKKVSIIYMESGFSHETTFYRAFKTVTGMTPKEWLEME